MNNDGISRRIKNLENKLAGGMEWGRFFIRQYKDKYYTAEGDELTQAEFDDFCKNHPELIIHPVSIENDDGSRNDGLFEHLGLDLFNRNMKKSGNNQVRKAAKSL